jgi:hypothetical protein
MRRGFTEIVHKYTLENTKGQATRVVDTPEAPPADPLGLLYSNPAFQASEFTDPLGAQLGSFESRRILRASPLTRVPPGC